MQANAILGVDIAKTKFDACLLVGSKERHKVFHNNQEGFAKLVAWCNRHGVDFFHLCLEATSCYSEDIVNFMYDLGHNVSLINPAQIKAFGKSELLRNKTDKSDAAKIARFCIANKPNLWKPTPPEVRRLRDLYRCLQALKDDKLQQMNRLENKNMDSRCKQAVLKVIATIETEISAIEEEINEHVNNYSHLKNMVENIKTIKGIGYLTAIAVIAEMPSVDNFDNARQFTAFAGLNPEHYQSGSSVNKKSRICKIGSERIRKALYMPAIVVKNYNSYFQKFCQRLKNKGKLPMVIVVALMRKLMHVFFGILKNNQPFDCNLVK
ncbi:transposase [Wolbachia endosymbiont (group A) of Endotricha flammealis]|uniref:transposase n=1 Tax=Wolbachia endosymbiont (group A) of Endotricha flammealis TaxID=2954004 RepID=UPI00222F34F8|nr:transposase [Wolbachia endosymbiont (group A) of Endotricha flammealis]